MPQLCRSAENQIHRDALLFALEPGERIASRHDKLASRFQSFFFVVSIEWLK